MSADRDRPVALITGSGRGIGRGIALALAQAGFDIAVNDRQDGEDLRASIAALEELGARAVPAIGDIAEIGGHAALLDGVEAALGPITTLVNNAGVSVLSRGDLLDVTAESYDRCQSVNTRGTFFLTQSFARRLLARERRPDRHHSIITVSSANAVAASINRGEYCVSKAGLSMASRLFAVRLGADEIGVYEIQPGLIETDMTAPSKPMYQERISQGLTVVQHMGQPSDIGSIAVAMATGAMAFATGQAIQADGGLLISRF